MISGDSYLKVWPALSFVWPEADSLGMLRVLLLANDVVISYHESSFLTAHASRPVVKGNKDAGYQGDNIHFILFPRGCTPFGQHQQS